MKNSRGVYVERVDRDSGVSEVLRDHLPLLRDAEVAVHRASRLSHDRLLIDIERVKSEAGLKDSLDATINGNLRQQSLPYVRENSLPTLLCMGEGVCNPDELLFSIGYGLLGSGLVTCSPRKQ